MADEGAVANRREKLSRKERRLADLLESGTFNQGSTSFKRIRARPDKYDPDKILSQQQLGSSIKSQGSRRRVGRPRGSNQNKPPGAKPPVKRERVNEEEVEEQVDPAFERKLIRKEADYALWMNYTPLLYDYIITHLLSWPALTCAWMTDSRVIIGTNSTEKLENKVIISRLSLPEEDYSDSSSDDDSEDEDGSRYIANIKTLWTTCANSSVHRIRVMPRRSNVFASLYASPEVNVFKLETSTSPFQHIKLSEGGHTKWGYGLSWSKKQAGHLLSCAEDGTICHWDLEGHPKRRLKQKYCERQDIIINDVHWSPVQYNNFFSVDEQGCFGMWDSRRSGGLIQLVKRPSVVMTSVAASPHDEYCVATGSSDGIVNLWDTRKLSDASNPTQGVPVKAFNFHQGDVLQVEWNLRVRGVFASSGEDARVAVWNTQPGIDQVGRDLPELLFVHGGHTDKVVDLAWNMEDDPWCLMSTAEDNILHIWS
eukprot:CAMPEP_0203792998 /NCGR_PEP_ID=MMETSP0100_2-20121128/5595_1 /ASSEMBLY_ACC=CAM_ASM_000210 /TAXON_ID=96639 /ORGANISM=" , Strain NY0313808BC1" /LENGTH=481 /DNA_ID=CAMNT_0050696677 /DNA_START=198 /DNA_END=1639 /DNA_ORIENTATION=+